MNRPTIRTRSEGFTLIELLVVIAVIALLVSILMPTLSGAKGLAQQVYCATNMKQLGLTFGMYADDNDEYLPMVEPWDSTYPTWTTYIQANKPVAWYMRQEWFRMAHPYMKAHPVSFLDVVPEDIDSDLTDRLWNLGRQLPVFDCPTTKNNVTSDHNGKPFDYIILGNSSATGCPQWDETGFPTAYHRLTDMDPDDLLLGEHLATEGYFPHGGPCEGEEYWLAQAAYSKQTLSVWPQYSPGYHHNYGMNILFPDNRVEWHGRKDYQPNCLEPGEIDWVGGAELMVYNIRQGD